MDEQEYKQILSQRFKSSRGNFHSIKQQLRGVLRIFREYVLDKNAHILDAGCHEGFGLRILKHWDYTKAEGVDYLYLLVRAAHRKGCVARQGDLHNLSFQDNRYDAIFSRYVLEHCHTPSKVVSELSRVLKPNGVLFFVVSTDDGDDQGLCVFHTIGDLMKIIPSEIETVHVELRKNKMKRHDIIYVGRKMSETSNE